MTVTSTNNSAGVGATDPSTASRVPKKTLGQDEFLKLITVQLAHQDPMKPMEDTSFIAQMAQFTSLEQSSQMSRDMAALRSDMNLQSATALLGREVTITTKDGDVTGTVDTIDNSTDTVRVSVGGQLYPFSNVVRVAPAAAPTTETQS